MARIRTVKPEFWEDEVVGLLPRDARLLFIATFNMADDEGLLRWTSAYIKASAFMYDDDITLPDVTKLMQGLTDAGLMFPYIGGVARQQMACVVNFRKHQKINRPQKSKLPPPSLQSPEVRRMYARRDNWTCQLCGGRIPEKPVRNDSHNLSIDHITPQSSGGADYPSNVRATHQACNKSRRNQSDDGEFVPPPSLESLNDSLNASVNGSMSDAYAPMGSFGGSESRESPGVSTESDIYSVNGAVNDSRTNSLPEGKGKEGKGAGKGGELPRTDDSDNGDALFESPGQPDKPAGTVTASRPRKPLDALTQQAHDIADAFWQQYKTGRTQSFIAVRGVVKTALSNGLDAGRLTAALNRLGNEERPVSANTLQIALQQDSGRHLQAVSGGYQPFQNPTDPNAYTEEW